MSPPNLPPPPRSGSEDRLIDFLSCRRGERLRRLFPCQPPTCQSHSTSGRIIATVVQGLRLRANRRRACTDSQGSAYAGQPLVVRLRGVANRRHLHATHMLAACDPHATRMPPVRYQSVWDPCRFCPNRSAAPSAAGKPTYQAFIWHQGKSR